MTDANFKHKRRSKKTKEDPDLAHGSAYFVQDTSYKKYLSQYKEEKEVERHIYSFEII